MKLKIDIEMDNDAFSDHAFGDHDLSRGAEACRILRILGQEITFKGANRGDNGILSDYNGNKVGTWKVTKR